MLDLTVDQPPLDASGEELKVHEVLYGSNLSTTKKERGK